MKILSKVLISFLIAVALWGGLSALEGGGFGKGISNVFKFYLWFKPNPAWNVGSLAYVTFRFLFWAIWILVFALLVNKFKPKAVYCSDCGQYLGDEKSFTSPCPRCQCNLYTTSYTGVGRRVR